MIFPIVQRPVEGTLIYIHKAANKPVFLIDYFCYKYTILHKESDIMDKLRSIGVLDVLCEIDPVDETEDYKIIFFDA